MSLSRDSSTGTSTQLGIHSLMKTAGLRLSGEAGSLSRRRGEAGPCAVGVQFSGAGGEPLRPREASEAGGRTEEMLVAAGGSATVFASCAGGRQLAGE